METELRKYHEYKRQVKFVTSTSGLWMDHDTQPKFVRNLLSLCSGITGFATFCGIFAFCVKYAANIVVLTKGLGILISYFQVPLKVSIIRFHQEEIRALNSSILRLFKKDLETAEYRRHLLAYLGIFFKFFTIFNYSTAGLCFYFALVPVLLLFRGKYTSMYPHVLPFSYVPGDVIYWCVLAHDMIANLFFLSAQCAFDALFGYYTLHLVGELRLLTSRFRALKSCSTYKQLIRECIRRHILLTKSHHLLERIFGFSAIWIALTCAIILCSNVFQVSQMKSLSILKGCYLACYLFLKLMQAFYYAWFGNIIKVESEACLEAAYDAHWHGSGDSRFMTDVLIVLSQKPLVFKAENIMVLSLDMFLKVVNTTVSYFFLLRTLSQTLG